jgi:hypothetical protein
MVWYDTVAYSTCFVGTVFYFKRLMTTKNKDTYMFIPYGTCRHILVRTIRRKPVTNILTYIPRYI